MEQIEKRLIELELRYMSQEQTVEELSDEVALCHKRLNELERQNRSLREMVQNLAPEAIESPDE
ncbi:MAG: SlyX family protein [Desulfuromonadales bacterium]|nr:SlyX family protein [Desulfuromonadales bacterium]